MKIEFNSKFYFNPFQTLMWYQVHP